jgi:hypothetical protein
MRARRAFLYVHTYLSQGQMTTTHHCHLLVLKRPHTQVPLVHHTNPPHPVAQPLPPSTEDTPSHRAIIPSLTEHRSVRKSLEKNGRRMAGATGLCAWPCCVCSPPPTHPVLCPRWPSIRAKHRPCTPSQEADSADCEHGNEGCQCPARATLRRA